MSGFLPSRNLGRRVAGWAGALCMAVFLAAAGPGMAQAQTAAQSRSQLQDITKKLTQIERQLRAVQRVVFPDGDLAKDFAAGQPRGGGDASRRTLLADIEVRLGRIDTQMRALTGSIEEMAHRQRQLENKFENFRGDLEFRMRDLEGGGAAGDRPKAGMAAPGESNVGLVRTPSPDDAAALMARQPRSGAEVSALNGSAKPAFILPEGTPEERYQFAFAMLRKGDYGKAEAAFLAFLEGHAEHRLAGNAQYWLGETYYVRKDYPRAASAFLAGFQNYGNGAKGADSLIKLGLTLSNMGQNEEACAAFYEIEVSYPEASDAIMRRAESEKARLGCE